MNLEENKFKKHLRSSEKKNYKASSSEKNVKKQKSWSLKFDFKEFRRNFYFFLINIVICFSIVPIIFLSRSFFSFDNISDLHFKDCFSKICSVGISFLSQSHNERPFFYNIYYYQFFSISFMLLLILILKFRLLIDFLMKEKKKDK